MIPDRLRVSEHEIRKAVARRQYGDLPRRLEDLQSIAGQHLAAIPVSDPSRMEIIRFVCAVIEWARLMLATQRQIWSAEMQRLPLIVTYARGSYLDRAGHSAPGTCLDL